MIFRVPIFGEEDMFKEVFIFLEKVDRFEDLLAFGDTKSTSLAEIILYINYDQSPRHIFIYIIN